MPSSLRFLTLMFATGDSLKTSTKPAIQSLMESATGMLKNGATPDVVDFAKETLDEVLDTVIPAIIRESKNDQKFLYNLHDRFQDIRDQLKEDNKAVFQLNKEEQDLSVKHKTCRATEHEKCDTNTDSKRTCEMEMYKLWENWVTEEEALRKIHDLIDGHFCPPDANGTTEEFRDKAEPHLADYRTQKGKVDTAETNYDVKVPKCRDSHKKLDTQSTSCNKYQTDLESKACEHAREINQVLATYYKDYAQAQSAYECATQEIMELERDRKREWITLQVVNCLLERIEEQNGVPCDETTNTVTDEVGKCEEKHALQVCDETEGEPLLCLDYKPVLEHPQQCEARDKVEGECLPFLSPYPCTGVMNGVTWESQEYGNLPKVPMDPFNHENPGCNAYPVCVPCLGIGESPTPFTIDACPGYTADACSTDESGTEHELTFVRSVEGKAGVRCCSIAGDICKGTDLPEGIAHKEHEGCLLDVTYQQALQACHSIDMRICDAAEIESAVCCNEGCKTDKPIWVDTTKVSIMPIDNQDNQD